MAALDLIMLQPIRTGLLAEERISTRYWTTAEDRLLRQHYPDGRAGACMQLLPRRTERAIRQRAYMLGLCKGLPTGRRPRLS